MEKRWPPKAVPLMTINGHGNLMAIEWLHWTLQCLNRKDSRISIFSARGGYGLQLVYAAWQHAGCDWRGALGLMANVQQASWLVEDLGADFIQKNALLIAVFCGMHLLHCKSLFEHFGSSAPLPPKWSVWPQTGDWVNELTIPDMCNKHNETYEKKTALN